MRRIRLLLTLLAILVCLNITSISAQSTPPDPRFGAVEVFWDSPAAVEAGVAWERILFYWSQLQPYGPDDWNTMHIPDEWLQMAQANGREVVGLLKNTPLWAAGGEAPSEASPPRGLELPIDDPNNLWASFVRRTVDFYGPRGVHRWIIWNEPDIEPGVYGQEWHGTSKEYYRLLKVAYLVIKQSDPSAQVHLAGLTYWHNANWLREFLAVATADPEAAARNYFFDVVSLHIYFQTDTVDFIVNETRAVLNSFGLTQAIWINETNASPDSDPAWPVSRPRWRVDLREQASFLLQAYALGLAAGVERIAVYKWIDSGLPAGGEPFGVLRPDHSRRPAFSAYQLITQHYAGAQSARTLRNPLWAQVTLNRGAWTTRVLWARTAAEVALTVPALAAQASLIDQEGNVQTLDGSAGHYRVTLPAARCVDEYAACFIGGSTYLLVEAAPAGDVPPPSLDLPTATSTKPPIATATSEITATAVPSPLPSATNEPPTTTFPPTPTAEPSATPSLSPSPIPAATETTSPTPLIIQAPAGAQATSHTPTQTLMPSAQPTPIIGPGESGQDDTWGSLLLGGLAAIFAVVGLIILVGLFVWLGEKRQV